MFPTTCWFVRLCHILGDPKVLHHCLCGIPRGTERAFEKQYDLSVSDISEDMHAGFKTSDELGFLRVL